MEIIFLLALEQKARQNPAAPLIENVDLGNEPANAGENLTEADFPALFEQSGGNDSADLRRILSEYQNKNESEKTNWRRKIKASIGADERFIDENIHRSHLENALQQEIPAIRRVIANALLNPEISDVPNDRRRFLNHHVVRAFASQFVSLSQIKNVSAFDKLSGPQLARLIRLAGVREVSTACLRIEAVEAVAAFIRNFPPEDARMIAAHLTNVPEVSEERIVFAENLVHSAFEIEPNPSAMLDWLGIRLIGILLCQSSPLRIRYTQQKLPLEFALRFSGMIEENCRRTPPDMQAAIAGEMERLAATVAETA